MRANSLNRETQEQEVASVLSPAPGALSVSELDAIAHDGECSILPDDVLADPQA